MEDKLTISEHGLPVNVNTGFNIAKSIIGNSGFNYIDGIRKFGSLIIKEGVAEGVGVIFINQIQVFTDKNELIIDKSFSNGIKYSREKVRLIVLNELINMLKEASEYSGQYFDESDARSILDKKLKLVYYSDSYEAIIRLGTEIGIDLK